MGQLLDALLTGSPVRRVYDDDGLSLYPLAGHQEEFDRLVRAVAAKAGDEYVALPAACGNHYDHLVLVPFSETAWP